MLNLLRHVCGPLGVGGTQFTDTRATLASTLFQSPRLPFAACDPQSLAAGRLHGTSPLRRDNSKWTASFLSVHLTCGKFLHPCPAKERKNRLFHCCLSPIPFPLLATSGGHQQVCYIHTPLGNEVQDSPLSGTPTLTTDYRKSPLTWLRE